MEPDTDFEEQMDAEGRQADLDARIKHIPVVNLDPLTYVMVPKPNHPGHWTVTPF